MEEKELIIGTLFYIVSSHTGRDLDCLDSGEVIETLAEILGIQVTIEN